MNKKLFGALLAVPVMGAGATMAFANENKSLNQGFELSAAEIAYFEQVDTVIAESDWEKLSDKEIDAKLKAAGVKTMFDTTDPLYNMTPKEIDALTDAQWEKIDAQYEQLHGDDEGDDEQLLSLLEEKDDIIKEAQAAYQEVKDKFSAADQKTIESLIGTLKNAQTEEEMEKTLDALFERTFDVFDTHYNEEVEEVSEYAEISDEDRVYFERLDKVISESDWDTLSAKQIDAKLTAAGLKGISDEQDPLYAMTPKEIDALTDAQWEKIDAEYAKLYPEEVTN